MILRALIDALIFFVCDSMAHAPKIGTHLPLLAIAGMMLRPRHALNGSTHCSLAVIGATHILTTLILANLGTFLVLVATSSAHVDLGALPSETMLANFQHRRYCQSS